MSRPPSPMLSVPEKRTAAAELFRDRHFLNSAFFSDVRDARASAADPNSCSQSPSSRRALLPVPLLPPRPAPPLPPPPLLRARRPLRLRRNARLHLARRLPSQPQARLRVPALREGRPRVQRRRGRLQPSRIAAAVNRGVEGGVKEACAEFQRAAGAFRAVGEMMEGEEGVTVDMSPQDAAMLERLMLAQAQECCFERALAAGTSPAACSKVARQAGLYYEEAYAALLTPPLQNHFERSWVSQIQLKAAQLNAEACYRYAIELHEKTEIGEEIARLQVGINAIVDAKKTARGAPGPLYDSASRLEQDMKQSLERAVSENNRIYLMRVLAAKLLTPLPAASLVRSASLSEILDSKAETDVQPA